VKSKETKPEKLAIATEGNKVATVDATIDPRFPIPLVNSYIRLPTLMNSFGMTRDVG
jgi:hypothetical protein